MVELELRGAISLLERAVQHTYGSDPTVRGSDHLFAIFLLNRACSEVKALLKIVSSRDYRERVIQEATKH